MRFDVATFVLSAAACGSEPPAPRCPELPATPACSPAAVGEPVLAAAHDAGAAGDGDAGSKTLRGIAAERAVLVEFYKSTRGANWIKQDHWLSDSVDHCQWHGVECDESGYVGQLTLYDNDLDGPLPESLCRLDHLHTLYFSFNRISGELPKNIGHCKSLKNLWLKANNITGKIPDGICDSSTLEYIDLHVNSLTGPIPETLSRCTSLQVLRLDRNKLTGGLPKAIFALPKLAEIYVHHNKLAGPLDADVAKLRGLKYLYLGDNGFTGPIPPLAGLGELVTIRLEHNQFTGALPVSLGDLPKLEVLRLDHNRLTGDVPGALAERSPKLGVCDLSENTKLACASCDARCGVQAPAMTAGQTKEKR